VITKITEILSSFIIVDLGAEKTKNPAQSGGVRRFQIKRDFRESAAFVFGGGDDAGTRPMTGRSFLFFFRPPSLGIVFVSMLRIA
jgi:hypothetical protein